MNIKYVHLKCTFCMNICYVDFKCSFFDVFSPVCFILSCLVLYCFVMWCRVSFSSSSVSLGCFMSFGKPLDPIQCSMKDLSVYFIEHCMGSTGFAKSHKAANTLCVLGSALLVMPYLTLSCLVNYICVDLYCLFHFL